MVQIKEIKRVEVTGEIWMLYEIITTPDVCLILTVQE